MTAGSIAGVTSSVLGFVGLGVPDSVSDGPGFSGSVSGLWDPGNPYDMSVNFSFTSVAET